MIFLIIQLAQLRDVIKCNMAPAFTRVDVSN